MGQKVWSLFTVCVTKLSSQMWVLPSVPQRKNAFPMVLKTIFCLTLFIILRLFYTSHGGKILTSSLEFIFPSHGWMWKRFMHFPQLYGNTHVITWRCYPYKLHWLLTHFIVLTLCWTLLLSILHRFHYLLLTTHPWSLLLLSPFYRWESVAQRGSFVKVT